jgi:molybdopterin-guanine dinucleotide biosynthesis protein A
MNERALQLCIVPVSSLLVRVHGDAFHVTRTSARIHRTCCRYNETLLRALNQKRHENKAELSHAIEAADVKDDRDC